MHYKMSEMIGVTMKGVVNEDDDALVFEGENGRTYKFYHMQDCCEIVYIEDVCGDLKDLVGSPILQAEEVDNVRDDSDENRFQQWTYYKFATNKGAVSVRWYGTSNGQYATSVSFRVFG